MWRMIDSCRRRCLCQSFKLEDGGRFPDYLNADVMQELTQMNV